MSKCLHYYIHVLNILSLNNYLLFNFRRTTTLKTSTTNILNGYEDLGVNVLDDTHIAKRCRYLNPNSTVNIKLLIACNFSILNWYHVLD